MSGGNLLNPYRKSVCRLLCLLALTALLTTGALAATLEVDAHAVSCLSQDAFSDGASALSGIYVSAVPASSVCELRCGARSIRAGDVLPVSVLDTLTLAPSGEQEGECSLYYRPIYSNGVGIAQELRFSLLRGKNQAPSALDGALETYKNIANRGTLRVSDPDGDALTFTLVREPKRGTVELHGDGTFTYTPLENKVGKDSFSYTATDAAGNISNEACVKVRIVKPTDKAVYDDLTGSEQYLAVWLRERGVYTGKSIGGHLCFSPQEPVGRGEFLVMAMRLLGAEPDDAALTSGFADETATPVWMRPYIVAALRSGAVSGAAAENGVIFRPADALTHAEAAVMVQGLLALPEAESRSVFSEEGADALPVWARGAAGALETAGIALDMSEPDAPLTRLEAASTLRQAYLLQNSSGQ